MFETGGTARESTVRTMPGLAGRLAHVAGSADVASVSGREAVTSPGPPRATSPS
jgi:hypothetical protein